MFSQHFKHKKNVCGKKKPQVNTNSRVAYLECLLLEGCWKRLWLLVTGLDSHRRELCVDFCCWQRTMLVLGYQLNQAVLQFVPVL